MLSEREGSPGNIAAFNAGWCSMSLYYSGLAGKYEGKVSADIAASGVAGKEWMNLPVRPDLVEAEQPEHLRAYFKQRLEHYRRISQALPPHVVND
ncbi:DNA polymerase III subunit theta [Serratia rubidaea]